MSNAEELEQDAADDESTKAQVRRHRPIAMAIIICVGVLFMPPHPSSGYDGDWSSYSHSYTWLKPKWKDPDEPLCVIDADDLEDADCLLRASQEPMQAQSGVLLRAAGPGREQREEQLLRAAGGQEDTQG